MSVNTDELNGKFNILNDIVFKHENVILGSTSMARFPLYELINKSRIENVVYNRSVEGLTISDAKNILHSAVIDICPEKVFISLGENDEKTEKDFSEYSDLVRTLKSSLKDGKIYLLSVFGYDEKTVKFNEKIKKLCDGKRIIFIDMDKVKYDNYKVIFKKLSLFFRGGKITDIDALQLCF